MIVYLDVNVVLDFLLGDREFSLEVAQVLSLLSSDGNKIFTGPNAIINKAIAMSSPKDLEDGFQIVLAQKCGAEILITNDKKGFRDAPMKVMNSREFLLSWEFS